jgi:hypothetical protein
MPEPRSGLYYVIPAQVIEDPELDHPDIVFYAILSGLAERDGYCFASNKHLAQRMRRGTEQIEKYLKKLETLGYIRRETIKNGLQWDRKIFINHEFKKSLRSLTDEASKPIPGGIEAYCIPPIVSKALVSKDTPVSKDTAPLPEKRQKIKEEKIEVAKDVWLTAKQKKSFEEEKLKGNIAFAESCYKTLSEWKIGKEIVGGNDYKCLISWVIRATEEKCQTNKKYRTGSTNFKPGLLAKDLPEQPLPPQGLIMTMLQG